MGFIYVHCWTQLFVEEVIFVHWLPWVIVIFLTNHNLLLKRIGLNRLLSTIDIMNFSMYTSNISKIHRLFFSIYKQKALCNKNGYLPHYTSGGRSLGTLVKMAIGDEVALASDPNEVVLVLLRSILATVYLESFPFAHI